MKILLWISAIILLFTALTGCAHYFGDVSSISASNIRDLERAKLNGKEKIFDLSYDTAFDKSLEVLKNSQKIIFQESRKYRYIVAMGFPRQVDTTRAGFFFEIIDKEKTKITVSSLSSTTRDKAASLVFDSLETL